MKLVIAEKPDMARKIAAVIGADSSYPSLGFVRPIEVKVNENDYELAMSILAAADKAE